LKILPDNRNEKRNEERKQTGLKEHTAKKRGLLRTWCRSCATAQLNLIPLFYDNVVAEINKLDLSQLQDPGASSGFRMI
jgi:hypothetical protein